MSQPRKKVGGRPYKWYSEDKMKSCLRAIDDKVLTQREAAKKFNIPRSSIILRRKMLTAGNPNTKPGRKCVFTDEEERAFVDHVIQLCDFGFPVTDHDLQFIVKTYVDGSGREIKQFSNNYPGRHWMKNFLKRYKKDLSQRFCSNIKRARAAVGEEELKKYFANLSTEITDANPDNIYNYDETNLVDDPGNKKILTKRGCKYPEAIKNATKASVSLMMCGNASGTTICPPYVNYRAEKLWDTWMQGGPPNTRYNRTKSGWFDGCIFEDWFFTIMMPIFKKSEGKKVLIGDNLSSHVNLRVLKACKEENIAFIALPPNSTHLTQPLDIAFFRPMKLHWRAILDDWKMTPDGRRLPTVPKSVFPSLLHKLWVKISVNGGDNLKSGFRKAGIMPLDETQVLRRLPTYKDPNQSIDESANISLISDSFTKFLEDKRKEAVGGNTTTPQRKKKLNVEAGKSISAEEVERSLSEPSTSGKLGNTKNKNRTNLKVVTSHEDEVNQPSTSTGKSNKGRKAKKRVVSSSDESDEDHYSLASESDADEMSLDDATQSSKDIVAETNKKNKRPVENDYVVVNYEGARWPGQIQKTDGEGAYIKCMSRCGMAWKWPEKEDCIFYSWRNVLFSIKIPKRISTKRELYNVPELESEWGIPKK